MLIPLHKSLVLAAVPTKPPQKNTGALTALTSMWLASHPCALGLWVSLKWKPETFRQKLLCNWVPTLLWAQQPHAWPPRCPQPHSLKSLVAWGGCPGMANPDAAGKSFKGFGSLDNREWKCPFAKSTERQQALHCFNVSEAWINLTPRLDSLSYEDGFNIDSFCIILYQLLLATGWKSSRNFANDWWFENTWDILSTEMPLILEEMRTFH